ncbi:MAG: hypothetical protein AB7H97_17550 [Pseudobdellovibrionaceae bacterium]
MKKTIQLFALSLSMLVSSSAFARTFTETKLTVTYSYSNMDTEVVNTDSLVAKIKIIKSDDDVFCKFVVEGVSIPCKSVTSSHTSWHAIVSVGAVQIGLDYFQDYLNALKAGAGGKRAKNILLDNFRSEMAQWTPAEMSQKSQIIWLYINRPQEYSDPRRIEKQQIHSDNPSESVHRTYEIESSKKLN